MWPSHIHLLDCFFPCSSILVERYAYNFEVLTFILSVSFYQIRHFATARTAPASPEVNQYHFTFTNVVGQLHSLSFRSLHFEINKLSTYGSLFLLVGHLFDSYDCFVILEICRNLLQQSFIFVSRVIVERLFKQENSDRIGDVLLNTFFDYFVILFFQLGTLFLFGFFLLIT